MSMDFDIDLQKYLNKCELEYRAKKMPNGSTVDWLSPSCGSVEEIASYLRYIGFKIRRIVDEESCIGEKHQWVVTTSGVVVYVNTPNLQGLVASTRTPGR